MQEKQPQELMLKTKSINPQSSSLSGHTSELTCSTKLFKAALQKVKRKISSLHETIVIKPLSLEYI